MDRAVASPNSPPDISGAFPTPDSLWPPNHKMLEIVVEGISDPDGDDVSLTINEIVDNEGSDPRDFDIDGGEIYVRAERDGQGAGRTYTIKFTAVDEKGASASSEVTVHVPHDQGKKNRGAAKPIPNSTSWGQIKKVLR